MRERIINILDAGSVNKLKVVLFFSITHNELPIAGNTGLEASPELIFAECYQLNPVPSKQSFESLAFSIKILPSFYSAFASDKIL